jgi:8-oxo-dGTP pyrophosphatase MutT (NUDIX family)
MAERYTCDGIRAALNKPLPGGKAHRRMAPSNRVMAPSPGGPGPRIGAVMVLFYPAGPEEELHLVLTRRTDNVVAHKGQISFPGGGMEPEDQTTEQTALRETCEEVGVCGEDVLVIGTLSPVYIEPSNFCIHPYVAHLSYAPSFRVQPREVAEVLEVPFHHFTDQRNVSEEVWLLGGEAVRVPYFNVYGHKVWGATAIVLAELVMLVGDGPSTVALLR